MAHITIFFQVLSLILAAMVCFFFFQAQKGDRNPVVRPVFWYQIFSMLTILAAFFINYLGLNIIQTKGSFPFSIWNIGVFLVWGGTLYAFFRFVFALSGRKISSFFNGIFAAGMFVLGITLPTKLVDYDVFTPLVHINTNQGIYHLPLLIMIGTLADFLWLKKPARQTGNAAGRKFLGWLLPGYVGYLCFDILRLAPALLTSMARLYLVLALFFWYRKAYPKNEAAVSAFDNRELISIIGEKFPISNREKDILALLLDGKTNKEIGQTLFLSSSTIRNQISALYDKIGINSRGQLMGLVLKLRKGES